MKTSKSSLLEPLCDIRHSQDISIRVDDTPNYGPPYEVSECNEDEADSGMDEFVNCTNNVI